LNEEVYGALVYTNNLDAIKTLVNYGLDIHMVSKNGKSGIYFSVAIIHSANVFDFLLQRRAV
jgi:hypothetical protein